MRQMKVFFAYFLFQKKVGVLVPCHGTRTPGSRGATHVRCLSLLRSTLLAPVAGSVPRPSPGPLIAPSSPTPFRGTLPAAGVLLCPGEAGYSCAVLAVSFHLIPNSAKSQRPFSPLGGEREIPGAGRGALGVLGVGGALVGGVGEGQTGHGLQRDIEMDGAGLLLHIGR